jgi:hypothetical protein
MQQFDVGHGGQVPIYKKSGKWLSAACGKALLILPWALRNDAGWTGDGAVPVLEAKHLTASA